MVPFSYTYLHYKEHLTCLVDYVSSIVAYYTYLLQGYHFISRYWKRYTEYIPVWVNYRNISCHCHRQDVLPLSVWCVSGWCHSLIKSMYLLPSWEHDRYTFESHWCIQEYIILNVFIEKRGVQITRMIQKCLLQIMRKTRKHHWHLYVEYLVIPLAHRRRTNKWSRRTTTPYLCGRAGEQHTACCDWLIHKPTHT